VAQLRPGESESEVVKRADRAMYRAKQAGKNRVFTDA
jgi:PleD family two-component response regulator